MNRQGRQWCLYGFVNALEGERKKVETGRILKGKVFSLLWMLEEAIILLVDSE